ncbi:type II toxin-antitoxin system RelE/ParE family toxin [Microbulbifer halophilus]|uniref:Type II toxin-antitoxin system RelE/ParE family toxin n=1 Tax=Microbulbifer halophilus TaxID=453963 RepID=A0ABW5E7K5_9GAMM|nr:type II toxin-antitoxin system RelE/ParE family toxin [Microbulbifer halophilus]MCW8125647.1 type II toxin-antitoxin system RelE/ParE family toxin [Microbulbifer halophilus]
MEWAVNFCDGVEDDILKMPPKLQARMLRLLELIESYGANLGAPHTAPVGNGLFEIRAKASEGIARALFCYAQGKRIYILHAFVKKSQKLPVKELRLAQARMKEINHNE